MPDIALHWKMGEETRHRLAYHLDDTLFFAGLLGPDVWSNYKFWMIFSGKEKRKRSAIMHNERVDEFLYALTVECRNNMEFFSYTAGYICHWCLDKTVHPYIVQRSHGRIGGHISLENELDRCVGLLTMSFVKNRLQHIPSQLKISIEQAYATYGWGNVWRDLNHSFDDTVLFYMVKVDRYRVIKRLLSKFPQKRCYLYSWYDVWNDPNNIDHQFGNESIGELVEKAIKEAVLWIDKAWHYCRGSINTITFSNESFMGEMYLKRNDNICS